MIYINKFNELMRQAIKTHHPIAALEVLVISLLLVLVTIIILKSRALVIFSSHYRVNFSFNL